MRATYLALSILIAGGALVAPVIAQPGGDFQSVFQVDKKALGIKGSNPYFNLNPGYRLFYKNGAETDTITVLNETKVIDGVETRVVEDREMKDGISAAILPVYPIRSPVEYSRNNWPSIALAWRVALPGVLVSRDLNHRLK